MIVQGEKRIVVGNREYQCAEDEIMIFGVDLPASVRITRASPAEPCISLVLDLDKDLLAALALQTPHKPLDDGYAACGALRQPPDPEIFDAFFRLLGLLDTPERVPVLAPMLLKEIHYLLLMGPNGSRLRSFYALGSQNSQITYAISWLKQNLAISIQIEELAALANMSLTAFHRKFKAVTGLSPIQYQKRMRLHEAQRLMLTSNMNVANASVTVGYANLSQFSREYKRLFGNPPRKDIMLLRSSRGMARGQ